MKKRYWLFSNYSYYPHGGMRDFIGGFDSADCALIEFEKLSNRSHVEFDWFEVLDSETMKIVKSKGSTCYDVYMNGSLK